MKWLVAGHWGYHEFRICNADGLDNPTDECFQTLVGFNGLTQFNVSWYHRGDTPRTIIAGRPDYLYKDLRVGQNGSSHYFSNIFKIRLPENSTCSHCIFQV